MVYFSLLSSLIKTNGFRKEGRCVVILKLRTDQVTTHNPSSRDRDARTFEFLSRYLLQIGLKRLDLKEGRPPSSCSCCGATMLEKKDMKDV